MLGEISFVIIREIIKRIIEYQLIDNLILINYRFKSLIINDQVCQEHYLLIRYPKLKINCDNLKEKINILNSKRYSRFFESGIKDRKYIIFARPSDNAFIIYFRYMHIPFAINRLEIRHIIRKIFDEKLLEDIENILIQENFFLSENRISKKILEKIEFHLFRSYILKEHDGKIILNFSVAIHFKLIYILYYINYK